MTLFPIVILIFVAISSLSLLYSIEEGFTCKMSAHIVVINGIGHIIILYLIYNLILVWFQNLI